MKQQIIFTALPNGINPKTKNLKISVSISLQVTDTVNGTTLTHVPDMLTWADLINRGRFIVQVNGASVEATKITPNADLALWKNIFSQNVHVNPFVQEDKTQVPILSYPVKHVASYIKFIVEETGKNFVNDLPDSNYYTGNPFFTGIANYAVSPYYTGQRQAEDLNIIVTPANRGAVVKRLLRGKPFIPFNSTSDPALDFAQLSNFHGLYDVKSKAKFTQFAKPDFEFHDILSVLTQYPKLMRRLGLVIDFEIPNKTFPTTKGTPAIRVFPTGLAFITPTTITCPGTAFEKTAKGFYSKAEKGSFHDKGHVKINTDAFTVFQFDTDGAALKLTSHVDALLLKKGKHNFYGSKASMPNEAAIPFYNNEETPRREGLPSHRSAGIGLAKNGMAEYLHSRFVKMNVLKSAFVAPAAPPAGVSSTNATYILGTETLFADDVTIGYRMDVKMTDKAGTPDTWHSLHFHENTYSYLSGNTNIPITDIGLDEGFIQLSTSEDENVEGEHMKLSEVIARWEGWSLAVPTPGLSLNEPTLSGNEIESSDAAEAAKYKTPSELHFRLNVVPVVAKGTLPRLRFGQTYSVKLRMVDMAGNSTDHTAEPENAADSIVSNVRYTRYEPVDAPFLVPGNIFVDSKLSDPDHNNFRDGESSEVMVIRSNEGQTVQQYENDPTHKYAAHAGVKAQPGAFRDVCTRHVKPPRTTVGMAITHSMLEQAIGKGSLGVDAVYNKIKNEKDPVVSTVEGTDSIKFNSKALAQVVNSDTVTFPVEYLVDPMAAGVSFFLSALDPNVKGSAAEIDKLTKRCSFYFDAEVKSDGDADKDFNYDAWMAPKTFRIVLKEGELKSEWSGNAQRTLTVSVPKGFMLKLNYACFWRPKDLEKISGVLQMFNLGTLSNTVMQSIMKGRHWLFSPWRTLTFVHAVQQPVTKAIISQKTLPFINNATSERNFGETFARVNIELEVHGASTGVVDLEASWIDWVDDVNDLVHNGVQQMSKKAKVHHYTALYKVYHYVFGDFPAKKIINNPFKAPHHQFNDTRHRWVDYQIIASTRYKECFYNLINEKKGALKITRESNVIEKVNVLSSARPAAPQVAYVIPTFEWERTVKGDLIVTGRVSGLRVYIKRPWYSSGEGEKLAVIVKPPDAPSLVGQGNVPMEQLFTTWGNDPTKSSSGSGGIYPPLLALLGIKKVDANNLYTEENLSISELEGTSVNIGAYDVQYDAARQMYFADIMINFGLSYFPFIRLALAAYQQHSVRKNGIDCCLSKIVQADYIQIPPPRFTSFQRKGTDITVAISGTLPAILPGGSYIPKIEFVVENADFPKSEEVVITVDSKPIDSYSHIIQNSEIKNFSFNHSHTFKLPAEYATKPCRVKIFEYEMISFDPRRATYIPSVLMLPAMKDRMVFADVYEVNM